MDFVFFPSRIFLQIPKPNPSRLGYAFADKLRTFEGGIPAASDGGFAGRAADTGVAVGCFCLIAVATC